MTPLPSTGYEQLSLQEAANVDEACDRFEQAWKAAQAHGEPPRIVSFLDGTAESERMTLLRELIALDQECRQRYGYPVQPEDYHEFGLAEEPVRTETGHVLRAVGETAQDIKANWPRLPGFELQEVVGAGGMGIVYRARQAGLDRSVAVKMLRDANLIDAGQRERFHQEARTVARLQHAHLVQVYEFGEVPSLGGKSSQPYLVLEYVGGGSLAERLRGEPSPPAHVARLVETLARAIHYAHEQGIIHRDLKPGNVLLQKETESSSHSGLLTAIPKITDFGLARLEAGAHLTQTGDILGTPSYMAPEQTMGKSAAITAATDVYGLGAILYECLTGRPPFKAETALATLAQVQRDDPVSPRRLQPTVPRDLETICLKCLRKEPRQRYASAQALADDLRRFLADESILARPIGTGERVVKWAGRRPAVAALLGGIVVVTLLGLSGTTSQWLLALGERKKAEVALKQEEEAKGIAEARRIEADTRSYFNRIGRAYQDWWWQTGERAEQLLAECGKQTPDLCRWEWHYLDRLYRNDLFTLEHADEVQQVLYSPDGQHLATCSGRWHDPTPGEVRLWDAATGGLLHTFASHKQAVYSVAFHPGGRFLASADRAGTVRVWDMTPPHAQVSSWDLNSAVNSLVFSHDGAKLFAACADGHLRVGDLKARKVVHEFLAHAKDVFGVALSPDGRWLASAGFDGRVRIGDLEQGGEPRSLFHHRQVRRVAFSPDGGILASATEEGTVNLWNLKSETAAPLVVSLNAGAISSLAFHPDGRYLAVAPPDGSVRFLEVRGGRVVRTLRGHGSQVTSLAFSSDGRHLATAGPNRRVKVWDLTAPNEPHSVNGQEGTIAGLAVSPDGKLLATAGSRDWKRRNIGTPNIWLVRLTDGQWWPNLRGHETWLTCVAFRPDGKQLASGSEDGTARLWDVKTHRAEQVLRGHQGTVTSLAYDPKGKFLLTASADKSLRLWDVATGEQVREFLGHTDKILAAAYSPDGQHVVSGGAEGTVRIWEAATGRPVATFLGHTQPITAVAYSPGSDVVASADADQVRLYSVRAGQEWTASHTIELGRSSPELEGERTTPVMPRNTRLAFSRDGTRLATASPLRPIQLWDVHTGWEALVLPGPPRYYLDIRFSPAEDDDRLFAAAMNWIYVWDAKLQDREARMTAALSPERVLGWHADEARKATESGNPFAALFHADQRLKVQPNHAPLLAHRGAAYAALGQEEKALADLSRARKLAPKDHLVWSLQGNAHVALGQWEQAVTAFERVARENANNVVAWYDHAIAQLGRGRSEDYRTACAEMLKRFGNTRQPATAGFVIYALAPLADVPDREVYLQMVERAIPQIGGHERVWAAVHYRTGRFKEAIASFEKAHGGFTPGAWECLFLAMAHQQLQQAEQARAYLALALQWIDKAERAAADPLADGPRWRNWRERVEVQTLRREAATVLGLEGRDKR